MTSQGEFEDIVGLERGGGLRCRSRPTTPTLHFECLSIVLRALKLLTLSTLFPTLLFTCKENGLDVSDLTSSSDVFNSDNIQSSASGFKMFFFCNNVLVMTTIIYSTTYVK